MIYHCVLRVLKTSLWDPRCQTYFFLTKIAYSFFSFFLSLPSACWNKESYFRNQRKNIGILFSKNFWSTVRNNCSIDREKLFKLEAEGREFVKILRSIEQFNQTGKDQFLKQNAFLTCSWSFLRSNILQQLEFRLEKNIGI